MAENSHTSDVAQRLLMVKNNLPDSNREVTLIAVSKTFPPETIWQAIHAGQRVFGENRVQEAVEKWPGLRQRAWEELGAKIELHLIGNLQSNKCAAAVEIFDVIQTIDRKKILSKLLEAENRIGRQLRYFVQVNVDGEPQKSGVYRDEAQVLIEQAIKCFGSRFSGLMCIPEISGDHRYAFQYLAKLAKRNTLPHLSMGMSSDFLEALDAGATHIRIGRSIFGARTGLAKVS